MKFSTRKQQIVGILFAVSLLGMGGWVFTRQMPPMYPGTIAESAKALMSERLSREAAAPQMAMMDTAMENRAGSVAQSMVMPASPTQLVQPQVIQTASLSMTVAQLPETMNRLEALTRQYQGVITNQSVSVVNPEATQRAGSFEVRVPSARLGTFLDELDGLGTVLSQNLSGNDVGAQMVDFEARVRNLKSQEAALQQIMQRSGKIPEVLQVANELGRVRGEIEQYQGQLNYLKQQVAYSTVTLSLQEASVMNATQAKPALVTAMANSARQALAALYDVTLKGTEVLVWAVVFAGPLLLLLGGLLFVLLRVLPVRQWMRRT